MTVAEVLAELERIYDQRPTFENVNRKLRLKQSSQYIGWQRDCLIAERNRMKFLSPSMKAEYDSRIQWLENAFDRSQPIQKD